MFLLKMMEKTIFINVVVKVLEGVYVVDILNLSAKIIQFYYFVYAIKQV